MYEFDSDTFIYFSYLFCRHFSDPKTLYKKINYHCIFHIFNINRNNNALFNIVHMGLFISESWAHHVCSFEDEFKCSLITNEFRENVWIHMNKFQRRNSFLLNVYKMIFVINDNMFAFLLIICLHFERHNFGLLRPEYRDLLLT